MRSNSEAWQVLDGADVVCTEQEVTAAVGRLAGEITAKLSDPVLRAKALASLDKEERDLRARREALQGLIGEGEPAPTPSSTTRKRATGS